MYYFDQYGWLTSQPIEGRSTDVAPPQETETLKANWTGVDWVLVEYVAPPVPVPPPPPFYQWYLDVGSYYDRFGVYKIAMLSSTDPIIAAAVKDTAPRNYINLQLPEVSAVLAYAAGVTVPGLGTIGAPIITETLMESILTTPPAASEQLSTILYLKNTGQL